MSRLLSALVLTAAIAAAAAAHADEPIPTAADGAGAPASAPPPSPLSPPSPFAWDDDIVAIGPCGDVRRASDTAPPDRKPHGQVEVGVGTGGYRHVAGVVCKPIGDNSAVTIAVDYTEWKGRRHRFAEADGALRSPDELGRALPPVDGRAH